MTADKEQAAMDHFNETASADTEWQRKRELIKTQMAEEIFLHITPSCDHDFKGWRDFEDGRGGEQVCTKCGMGAMADSLRNGP